MQVGRLNAVAVAENWRPLMQRVLSLTRSQVYHTLSVHVPCLQHITRGLSATVDPCLHSSPFWLVGV